MMFPGYQHMDPSWFGWMAGGSILFWLTIVALVIFAVVRLAPPRGPASDALALLDQRLARGEIGAEEYRSSRDLIRGR